ncbi:DASH family cryptochrome [Marinobacter hydrocarbonoclasticus]|nr:DASH family cryptochrome [Marinobacter nauticus]
MKRSLLWLRHDLRIDDHPALLRAAQARDHMVCLYCIDPRWFVADNWQSRRVGHHPWRFIHESLVALSARLETLGQRLVIRVGDPVAVVTQLMRNHWIDKLVCSAPFGEEERGQYLAIQNALGHHRCEVLQAQTLFEYQQLPFELSDLPATFSQFRKAVAKHAFRPLYPAPQRLPPPLQLDSQALPPPFTVPNLQYQGGESAGKAHLAHYFASDAPQSYKLTRNDLDEWSSSTKLSPWLAQGCLSARQVMAALDHYQATVEKNGSTEWIGVELLWREYFYWFALSSGPKLFAAGGRTGVRRHVSFYPERFARWCAGETPFAIVNAAMRQLNHTGFLSNRLRQLVASALVHELEIDWRYGAAYFQQQLIDHDLPCNWGNWQYLAGVGADPRGGRRFDLAKQTEMYDPDGRYRARWQGEPVAITEPLDEAGWPQPDG